MESIANTTLEPTNNFTQVSYPTKTLAISVTSCSLSLIGACFIFGTYWKIKEIRTPTRRLIVALTLADCLSAAGYLISVIRYWRLNRRNFIEDETSVDSILCVAQSIMTSYCSIVSFLLTMLICFLVFYTVYTQTDQTSDKFWTFNAICWILPVIVIAIAASFKVFGEGDSSDSVTGPWCWVKPGSDINNTLWMLVTGKAWEILCYMSSILLYFSVKWIIYIRFKKRAKKVVFHEVQDSFRDDDENILYIWLPLYIVRLWGTVRFFLLVFDDTPNDTYAQFMDVFLNMQAFGDPSQAFCNFIIFVMFDKVIRRKMRLFCITKLGCADSQNELRSLLTLDKRQNTRNPVNVEET